MRFSDERLAEFQEEFRQHVAQCNERFKEGEKQFNQLLNAQQKNSQLINTLMEETHGIVKLHRDWQGAARVGSSVQKFGVWLAKWGTIGLGLATLWTWGWEKLVSVFD